MLGIVGESGCGKTTLVFTLLGLEQATAGRIYFEGQDVTHISGGRP
jgi:ABC-type oligopeptide transport system ATPase subunit